MPAPEITHKKFSKLTSLNFCSTWHTVEVPKENIDEQNDQAIALTGCRELELVFFGLKDNLTELHLGEWAYDDIIIYIAELCKKIQIIEINSTKVTDPSICEILKKEVDLKVLDISGCQNFVGVAFSDAVEHLVCTKL